MCVMAYGVWCVHVCVVCFGLVCAHVRCDVGYGMCVRVDGALWVGVWCVRCVMRCSVWYVPVRSVCSGVCTCV